MPVWEWVLDLVGLVLLLVLLYGISLIVRRRLLARHGGTFELSVRDAGQSDGRGWVLGMGRYREDSLDWYRIFSPLPRPRRSWRRNDLTFVSQREPQGSEEYSLYAGHVVVVCSTPRGDVELAMGPSSLMGFESWLESGPPGSSRPL